MFLHYNNNLKIYCRYGVDNLDRDVAKLRKLNKDLGNECIIDVADNSDLKEEFRYEDSSFHSLCSYQ